MVNITPSREQVMLATELDHLDHDGEKKRLEASQIERVLTPDEFQKDAQDYNRIDVSVLHRNLGARLTPMTPTDRSCQIHRVFAYRYL